MMNSKMPLVIYEQLDNNSPFSDSLLNGNLIIFKYHEFCGKLAKVKLNILKSFFMLGVICPYYQLFWKIAFLHMFLELIYTLLNEDCDLVFIFCILNIVVKT